MADDGGRPVVRPGDLSLAGRRCQRVPQHGGRLGEPQVDVAQLAQRAAAGTPRSPAAGCARRGTAVVGRSRSPPPARSRATVSVWRTSGGATSTTSSSRRQRSACQWRSWSRAPPAPSEARPSRQSVSSRGTLHGVGGEQARDAARDGPAARRAVVVGVAAAEVGGEVLEPGGAHDVVDHGEQRPCQPVGAPRVLGVAVEQHRDERVRGDEVDARAHPVAAADADAEAVGEPLGEPALDAARGHHHDLAGERVGQGSDQQVGQAVGERVGPLGGVEVQGHGRHPMSGDRHRRPPWPGAACVGEDQARGRRTDRWGVAGAGGDLDRGHRARRVQRPGADPAHGRVDRAPAPRASGCPGAHRRPRRSAVRRRLVGGRRRVPRPPDRDPRHPARRVVLARPRDVDVGAGRGAHLLGPPRDPQLRRLLARPDRRGRRPLGWRARQPARDDVPHRRRRARRRAGRLHPVRRHQRHQRRPDRRRSRPGG